MVRKKDSDARGNKVMIQLLLRNIISCNEYNAENMIMSSMIYEEEMLPSKLFTGEEIPELNNWLEEADSKVIVHVEYAVRVQKCLRVIVLSNDTDTWVHHFAPVTPPQNCQHFLTKGLTHQHH